MKLVPHTALGIDISRDLISLALVKKGAKGVELLKSASAAVPEGAIKNGNVEDYAALFKAVKELKSRNRMRSGQAAVSLLADPVLIRIMDIPRQVAGNMGQFVQNELKHCVALSGREIALDFCGTGSRARSSGRLFVVAADGQRVTQITKACTQSRLNVTAIEPPLLAYIRAFYAGKIADKFDCNVLLAIVRDGGLTVCVFRKQTLDFVRTTDIGEQASTPNQLCQLLAEQIKTVVQFYDVEVPDSCGQWEVSVIVDASVQLPENAEGALKAEVGTSSLQVRTGEKACYDTAVGQSEHLKTNSISPAAIGLAMKLLDTNGSNLRINLLPAEPAEVKSAKKDALITANIIAAVLVLMLVAVSVLTLMAREVDKKIARKKKVHSLHKTHQLLKEQESVDRHIAQLSDRPARLNEILNSRHDIDWARLLGDVRSATPKTVRVMHLFSRGANIYLEGQSLSYGAVRLFVNMLNKSEYIDSASLTETEKDDSNGGLVKYTINCSLKQGEER